ncbi:MACRO domain containing 2 [Nothobranchius furzeri]|uniref:MACRO domain containing 2 n=1 Tax=Nothobranchius furzeri TaxID=105023 RepID=A0A9D3BV57_NOTFU|nr:MACRO domain containing 2 [Nothobranchius furzeri]
MSKKKKDWRTEKERLLQLPQEERRKEYRKETWLPLDKIPTWREDDRSTENEEEKEVAGGGGDGGEGRGGGGLSDKVSLYKGDITLLEVDAIVNAGRHASPLTFVGLLATKVFGGFCCPLLVDSGNVVFSGGAECDSKIT